MTIFANGNNIAIVGDLVRRTLTAHIDAQMEVPEERPFKFDPVDWVKSDRGKYLAAIFTIARAYIEANEPNVGVKPLAGFEGWSRMVRRPLIWLGLPDPVETMKEARAMDPNRMELQTRRDALLKIFGGGSAGKLFNAPDVYQKTQEQWQTKQGYRWRYDELRSAFAERNMDARSIGKLLAKDEGKRSGGYWLERARNSTHGHGYRIAGEPPVAPSASASEEEEF
jgi:putative DNA primase/helicase